MAAFVWKGARLPGVNHPEVPVVVPNWFLANYPYEPDPWLLLFRKEQGCLGLNSLTHTRTGSTHMVSADGGSPRTVAVLANKLETLSRPLGTGSWRPSFLSAYPWGLQQTREGSFQTGHQKQLFAVALNKPLMPSSSAL
eukprot:1160432-Pelagomonas_calceolata.AAC.17